MLCYYKHSRPGSTFCSSSSTAGDGVSGDNDSGHHDSEYPIVDSHCDVKDDDDHYHDDDHADGIISNEHESDHNSSEVKGGRSAIAPLSSVPSVSAPLSSVPSVSAPLSSVPSVSAPLSSVPSVSAPLSSVPSVSAPLSSVPSVSAPPSVSSAPSSPPSSPVAALLPVYKSDQFAVPDIFFRYYSMLFTEIMCSCYDSVS